MYVNVSGLNRLGPTMTEISRSDQSTIAFLRMAAVEMRRLTERAPGMADDLRYIAGNARPKKTNSLVEPPK